MVWYSKAYFTANAIYTRDERLCRRGSYIFTDPMLRNTSAEHAARSQKKKKKNKREEDEEEGRKEKLGMIFFWVLEMRASEGVKLTCRVMAYILKFKE